MATQRQHVFVGKVLKRLFPRVPCNQEKSAPVTPAPDKPVRRVAAEEVPSLTDEDTKVPPQRRLYTVSLPPEGYAPAPPEPWSSPASEDTSGSDDTGGGCQLPGAFKDGDSAVSLEACQELLQRLEDHSVSPSDVLLVDHMKTLLLMRDTASLQRALERFPACCTMPPDQARVLSAFFNYWITHILPEKQWE